MMASGAFSTWISTPASAGPASCAPEREISSFEFPSDELVARHERRQIRHVRDVEEHRQHAEEEANDVELPDRQRVEPRTRWDRREQRRTTEVCRR